MILKLLAMGALLCGALQDTRTAVPDAAAQKEAEKTVREIFKSEYARKGAADRATQAGEWDVAWDAIVQSAIGFECDGLTMKVTLLAQAAKSVKTPEDAAKLVERWFRVADEAVKGDSLDVAEKAAA